MAPRRTDMPTRARVASTENCATAATYPITHGESPRSGVAPLYSERPHDRIPVVVDDGQQRMGGTVGNASAMFPFQQGPHIETKTIRELASAQRQVLA